MGGAQPLAVTMNEGVALVDRSRSGAHRAPAGDALSRRSGAVARRGAGARRRTTARAAWRGRSASRRNAADVLPALVARGVTPDVLTDQTSAHDALDGYVPNGLSLAEAAGCAQRDPTNTSRDRWRRWPTHVRAMLDAAGARRGDVRLRQQHPRAGRSRPASSDAFDIPGFVPEYVRPLFCEGKGPFRWAALSGDPGGHSRDRSARARDVRARRARSAAGFGMARERVAFQGLPARIFWLGYGERARFGLALNDLVRRGVVKAPIVIGRDHLDTGSVASPNRETEGMRDGSDAIADWPVLNALLNTSSGATWVSVHHGGGVGIGYSLHAGMVVVADGTREADEKLERVLTAIRASASCDTPTPDIPKRSTTARRHGIRIPMREVGAESAAVIVERPALERRVLASLDAGRIPVRARRLRHRPHVAAAAARADGLGARPRPVPRPRRGRDDARALPRGDAGREPRSAPAAAVAGARVDHRARRSTRCWRSSTTRRRRRRARRRSCSTRSSTSARSRVSRACVTCSATSVARLAASPARFVLASRFTARAHRLLRDAPARFEVVHMPPLDVAGSAGAGAAPSTAGAATGRRRRRAGGGRARRADARPYVHLLLEALAAHGAGDRSGGGAGGAVRARRPAHRALPRELRVPPASRARLRRAQGHPRHPRRRRAAQPDRDRAASAAHAGLDEGLSVVARGRGPDHVPRASATRSTIRCCGCTCGSTAGRCRRPTTTSSARSRAYAPARGSAPRPTRTGAGAAARRVERPPRSGAHRGSSKSTEHATRGMKHADGCGSRLPARLTFIALASRLSGALPCSFASASLAACCSASFFDRPIGAPAGIAADDALRRRSACGDRALRPPPADSAAGRGRSACSHSCSADFQSSVNVASAARSPADGDERPEPRHDELARRLDAAVEIDRRDERLEAVGENRVLLPAAGLLLAAAEQHVAARDRSPRPAARATPPRRCPPSPSTCSLRCASETA